ncbi:phytoene desaturase [Flavobacteriaceae bacterium F89]|uniref:Phytoene desaturase n=1 Tax=Cerina litoralis TaxID=2874477 RepID=A0AAE3EST9_9FLAO|nr:phytoene desaturase family protein [Cerina litoralis]MCG2459504.1 phytoene desaturase [Cerina litoralis]
MKKKVVVIGSGFSSLSASCYLAKQGFDVEIIEKNTDLGGRAGRLTIDGYTFDTGPSWYWMPDVFDRFFKDFGKKTSDLYTLDRLDPAYRVFFADETITIGSGIDKICQEFERIEKGSAVQLKKIMTVARENYKIAMQDIVLKPGASPLELVTWDTVTRIDRFFTSISREIRKKFKNPKLISVLEFPVLFLGAKPTRTPSFYSFMNFADFGLGTWHPKGGIYEIVRAMKSLCEELGVRIRTSSTVDKIHVNRGSVTGIQVNGATIEADVVVCGSDYHHSETLLDEKYRQYSEAYWKKRTFAPSSLLFYVGFDRKLANVGHHNLFFDTSFEKHAEEIYDRPQWPTEPLFYANFPSVTDAGMAPKDGESGFFLIPIAPDLKDSQEIKERYFDLVIQRFEERTSQKIRENIVFHQSFCVSDFKEKYNSYKGNAYGMANTLAQTAFLRPKLKSKKVKNLFFTGQLTVPGPGVPPALISGKLVSELIGKNIYTE